MIKACVIGWPISHSRSPIIHGYWLKHYNIEGSYERIAVAPGNLTTFLKSLAKENFAGCNVTIPHKELALSAIDYVDESVKQIGALNTVYIRNGKTHATSTDGEGFLQNLLSNCPNFNPNGKNITILGAGGSAKAIIERLLREDVKSITVANRTFNRAAELASIFGPKIKPITPENPELQSTDLLINTTSQGMTGQPALLIDLSVLPKTAIVADIVYVPLKTKLLEQAETLGLQTVSGLGMLLHQAVRGFELWFGVKPEVSPELYNLIAHDIDPDYQS
jgi:shikimate dehydrogenase